MILIISCLSILYCRLLKLIPKGVPEVIPEVNIYLTASLN